MEGKCSLILMYDSGKTLRCRISSAALRTLIIVVVLMPFIVVGSLWLNWKLFDDRRTALAENTTLRRELETNAQTVARLSGLEQFLLQNSPESLGDLVAVTPNPDPAETNLGDAPDTALDAAVPATAEAPSAGPIETPAPAASGPDTSVPSSAENTANRGAEPPVPALPPQSGTDETLAANAAASADTSETSTEAAPSDVDDIVADDAQTIDKGLARVESLAARQVGARSIRVSFDLFNTGQIPRLSGHTKFTLILKDGRAFSLGTHGDTTYSINRLKKIVGNPTLPAEINNTEGASIQIDIFAADDLIYRVRTPLQQ